MTAFKIGFEATPDPNELEILGRALGDFNQAQAGPDGFERLFVSARDLDGRLHGGLIGATYWGWLFIDLLFVFADFRGQGSGSALLVRAEHFALERHATRVFLDTFSFQAEDFYRRRGYSEFGALDGFPQGHRRVWMTKALTSTSKEVERSRETIGG